MSRVGHVEIARYDLAAKCSRCHKTIAYQKPMSLFMWTNILKAFVRQHRDCGGE